MPQTDVGIGKAVSTTNESLTAKVRLIIISGPPLLEESCTVKTLAVPHEFSAFYHLQLYDFSYLAFFFLFFCYSSFCSSDITSPAWQLEQYTKQLHLSSSSLETKSPLNSQ